MKAQVAKIVLFFIMSMVGSANAYAGETVGGLIQKGFKISGTLNISSQNVVILSNDKQVFGCVVFVNWQALLQGAPIQTQSCSPML